MNCCNGQVWLRPDGTVKLGKHSPDTGLTHCLDINYDPDAKCPHFDRALEEIFAKANDSAALIAYWHELAGYVLQPTRRHALIVIMTGAGGNGKTKLINTLMKLLGPQAVYSGPVSELTNDRFATGNLLGKFMFVDDDVRTGTRLDDGVLKRLSEEKHVTGEKKYKDKFSFICRAVPVLLCNNVPSLGDLSTGMLRRLHIIPFDRTFIGKEDDPELFERIWTTELPGILNRALSGWTRLQKRGSFSLPIDMEKRRASWLREANPLPDFIAEACERDAGGSLLLEDFYNAFQGWTQANGITRVQQKRTVSHNLAHMGYTLKHRKKGQTIIGLKLKSNNGYRR